MQEAQKKMNKKKSVRKIHLKTYAMLRVLSLESPCQVMGRQHAALSYIGGCLFTGWQGPSG